MSEPTPNDETAPSPVAPDDATTETTPAAPAAPATPAAESVPDAPTPAPSEPAPEPPAPSADVTQPDAPAVTAPAAPAPTVVPAAAAAPPRERRTVGVPVWLLVLLAAVVGAAAMFGIGYAVGNDSDDDTAAISVPRNNPFGDGDQQVPGIPNRPNLPNVPDRDDDQEAPETRPVSDTFLGVATEATDDGLEIVRLVPNSAAADAGLRVGDVIVEFDDDEVTTSADLADAVADHDPGDDVEIVYTRGGTRQTVTVELGSRNTTNSN